jgi:hypothetical protein
VINVAEAADVSRIEVSLKHAQIMDFQIISTIGCNACFDPVHTLFQTLQVTN